MEYGSIMIMKIKRHYPGRPTPDQAGGPLYVKKRLVMLRDEDMEMAKAIGDGCISLGIRRALLAKRNEKMEAIAFPIK